MAVERFPVEAGHIMMFARAIGDANSVYHDAKRAKSREPGGIIAPPTFVQASAQFDPDYPLRPKMGQAWFGSGKEASGNLAALGDMAGLLHAEQHYEYHRHVRPGDILKAETKQGKQWEKQGKAGKLRFSEMITEYRDQNDELVVTARGVSVITERPS
ncbi:MAG: MaoC family dehydratase N-terminal domain-containing protein [Candidatus Hydrogenedentota bacterium]